MWQKTTRFCMVNTKELCFELKQTRSLFISQCLGLSKDTAIKYSQQKCISPSLLFTVFVSLENLVLGTKNWYTI